MEDSLIEKLKDKQYFKKIFGFRHSFFALFMAVFFLLIGICIWALYFFGHLLNKGEFYVVGGTIIGLALIIWLAESTVYKTKFNKYYKYYIKAEKTVAPCYFMQEHFKKFGAMVIDTYIASKHLNKLDEHTIEAANAAYDFKQISLTNNYFSNGIIPVKKLETHSDGNYIINIALINHMRLRDENGNRSWYIKNLIYTDRYVFYSANINDHS